MVLRLIVLALGTALLAACAGHRSHPARQANRSRPAEAPTVASGSKFHDDLDKSQSSRYRDTHDSIPGGPPPDLSKLVEPVPKVEPRSRYGNKSPYTVLGQTYRVRSSARGYDKKGIASFYGNKFHGYKTSSLENYDMYAFSAASRTLPLPSYARVTNVGNGKSVIVRVNDRGPFVKDRIIDLSYAAAVKIGIWPKGTGLVEVQGIDPGHASPPPREQIAHGALYLQVGAFADEDNAARLAQRLRAAHLVPVTVTALDVDGHEVHRVRVGPVDDVTQADRISARIERLGLPKPRVAVD